MAKAKDLRAGDEFNMMITCMVLAVEPAKTEEKLVKVRVALLEEGSTLFADDDDLVVHLLYRPSQTFHTAREGEAGWVDFQPSFDLAFPVKG